MINIIVNNDSVSSTFLVHENFLCYHSPFFDKRAHDSSSGSIAEIILEKTNPETFGILINWIYSQILADCGKNNLFVLLPDLWILAERYEIPKLQNQVAKKFYSLSENTASLRDIIAALVFVHENTNPTRKLRELCNFLYLKCIEDLWMEDIVFAEVSREILVDVIRSTQKFQSSKIADPNFQGFLVEERSDV